MKKIFILFLATFFLLVSKCSQAYSFGIGKIVNNQRPTISYQKIIEDNNGFYLGKDEKKLYLTFDCGYENGYTSDILKTLKKNEVRATFFITGHYLTSSTDIVKKMIDDGHTIGNHTYHHNHFTKESSSEMLKDVKKLEDKYYELTNNKMSTFVRPPAGEFNEESLNALKENNYKTIFWSLAYVDWYKDKFYGNNYSYNNVMKKIHNGAIILMHTVSKDNMVDLDKILSTLIRDGYLFDSLENL